MKYLAICTSQMFCTTYESNNLSLSEDCNCELNYLLDLDYFRLK